MWRRLSGFAVLLAIATPLVVAPATPACACSCVAFTEPEAVARAEVVFDGVVLGLQGDDRSARRVRFAVENLVKGQAGDRVEVTTEGSSASCGYDFEVGRRYRVNVTDGNTGLCSGNRLLGPGAPTADPPGRVGPAPSDAAPPTPRRTDSRPADTDAPNAGPGTAGSPPAGAAASGPGGGPSPAAIAGLVATGSAVVGAAAFALYLLRRRRPGQQSA